jgi:predicted house-cleaning NTP pyrophosphatase (Maf/HAM1 superfamily)
LLGKDNVKQIAPRFTEDIMRRPINHQTAEWPIEMAENKALQDMAALMVYSYLNGVIETGTVTDIKPDQKRIIRIYSDTINITYAGDMADESTVVLEKPKNIGQWLADRQRGAMALSGKNSELCTALTAIDMTDSSVHPTTVLLRTAIKMRPFTIDEAKAFIARHGEGAVLNSASGVSFINDSVELFDTSAPLRTYIQKDPNDPPSLLFELPRWDHLTKQERIQILYGGIPQVIEAISESFKPAYPSLNGRSTAERYGSTPNRS